MCGEHRGGIAEVSRASRTTVAASARINRCVAVTSHATFSDVAAHLMHALKIEGVDHLDLGLDWAGGSGVVRMKVVTAVPRITDALLKAKNQ